MSEQAGKTQQINMAEDFHRYYPLLFTIAYRMLGSASDAEDIVQDCYVRYAQASPKEVRSLKSYLTTMVTRLCLDLLKSAHVQREHYIGPWLPEPVLTTNPEEVALRTVEQRESIATAFLVLLERLTPYERAVFLLHEVFGYRYEEIAEVVSTAAKFVEQTWTSAVRVALIQSDVPSVPATFQEVIGYRSCPREHVG